MPRTKRKWISGQAGSLHIISRTARNDVMLNEEEKDISWDSSSVSHRGSMSIFMRSA